jgi:hypothetical protein
MDFVSVSERGILGSGYQANGIEMVQVDCEERVRLFVSGSEETDVATYYMRVIPLPEGSRECFH